MEKTPNPAPSKCLNCGTSVANNFCPQCGQKNQPTRLPLRLFLSEAVSTFLNFDGLWWRTFRDLFAHPGKVTHAFNQGQRATYLPPLRTYLSISVIYFLTVQLIGQNSVLFLKFGSDSVDTPEVGNVVQYVLFLLVPVFALILQLFHLRRPGFFVEYLVFAIHIHSVWFVIFWTHLVINHLLGLSPIEPGSIKHILRATVSETAQILPIVYLILSLRRVFGATWMWAILKTIAAMFLYLFIFGAAVTGFLYLKDLSNPN